MIQKDKRLSRFFFFKYFSYGLHVGGTRSFRNSEMRGFIKGFRSNFCIYDLDLVNRNLRSALRLLIVTVLSGKKILFVGGPKGLEKDFFVLCRRYKHYTLDFYTDGLFTNFTDSSLKLQECPAIVFCFSLVENEKIKKEIKRLNVPVMAVVGTTDNCVGVDYTIPLGISDWRGSLYVYNLLSLVLALRNRFRIRKSGLF